MRRLLLVLGDQLDPRAPVLEALDPARDAILMIEAREEAEHVPSHPQRTALFLAAMRHYALDRREAGLRVRYVRLDEPGHDGTFRTAIETCLRRARPEEVVTTTPGEFRVEDAVREACAAADVPLRIEEDASFTCTLAEFRAWAEGRKTLTMETFYRERRRKLGLLLDGDGGPAGGSWNYDAENRNAFRRAPQVRRPYRARPDAVTREVLALVRTTWPDACGALDDDFGWPVTPAEARRALDDFVEHRLHGFGTWQDAMWHGENTLHHSLLSAALNLKLIRPRACVDAAVEAWEAGRAPLNDVEGFVRQIVGWREFIRGVYYLEGRSYPRRNALGQRGSLPGFFWDADVDLRCLRRSIADVLADGYGHHIPRLMVIGNFALIAGVRPREVHEWFLGMYVDAVEWVTAPNVVGMSQFADGGVVGSKPYAGAANYIGKMSNFCDGCRYDPKRRTGEDACPFNTFYWDFLLRHRERFAGNRRMGPVLSHLERMDAEERRAIRGRAGELRARFGIGSAS